MAVLFGAASPLDYLPKSKRIITRHDRWLRDHGLMAPPSVAWRFDRLPADVREAAEIASLRAGLSLSAWLTRLINETCIAEKVAGLTPPAPAAESAVAPRARESAGAAMLPVASMAPADLGTRHGDDVPDTLAADIVRRGVRQPLLVRRAADAPDRYEIICGHRRWRAAQRSKLAQVPAILCTHDNGQALLASLAENLSLGDLSPIDEAQAYLRLLTRCAVEVPAITQATGRDRQHLVRTVRLLGLPPMVRRSIMSGEISADHAYLLLDTAEPEALAKAIHAEQLSVEAARARIAAPDNSEAAS